VGDGASGRWPLRNLKKTQHPQEQPAGASGSEAGMVSSWEQTREREEENGRKETIGR
jgi:hypothetical protein